MNFLFSTTLKGCWSEIIQITTEWSRSAFSLAGQGVVYLKLSTVYLFQVFGIIILCCLARWHSMVELPDLPENTKLHILQTSFPELSLVS